MKISIAISLTIVCAMTKQGANAQILENSLFRIYRAESIAGASVQLQLYSDNMYQMRVLEIYCSLCDHNKLRETINISGKWEQNEDTIYLENTNRLLVIGDSIISPLYSIGLETDSLTQTQKNLLEQYNLKNKWGEFHLVYDTYPNGVAKLIVDRYRSRRNEYEIELYLDGTVKSIRYY